MGRGVEPPPKLKEADLYLPIKRFLESQHYEVKGEIRDRDVFAVRGSEDPVVVELKLALNLNVILQAVDRLAVTPKVRKPKPRQERLLGEFTRLVGDPNLGGTKGGVMTAYRQTALEIARFLQTNGPTKASYVARAVGEPNARAILYRDVVTASKIVPNCPRYIHKMQVLGHSVHAPRADYTPPTPAWKASDDFCEYLPARDRLENRR